MSEKSTTASGKEKNWVDVKVYHGGESRDMKWQVHWQIGKVLNDCIKAFEIQPAPNTIYYLQLRKPTMRLEDTKKVLDYPIEDGSELDLIREARAG